MIFDGYIKVQSILKLKELGLPTPSTIFVTDYETQKNEVNNFLMTKDLVMVRSDKEGQSMNCPRNLKCQPLEAKKFIKDLNNKGYVAILQNYVPLNNIYSGNILILKDSFIIEAMNGGPVSKLNREGKIDMHLQINKQGLIIHKHGSQIIPDNELTQLINQVKNLPLNYHIIEFSKGPDWMYYWQAREDKTSQKLEQ